MLFSFSVCLLVSISIIPHFLYDSTLVAKYKVKKLEKKWVGDTEKERYGGLNRLGGNYVFRGNNRV